MNCPCCGAPMSEEIVDQKVSFGNNDRIESSVMHYCRTCREKMLTELKSKGGTSWELCQ